MDASSRKQGAKRRNVLTHVTKLSNAVDEERAPKREQKRSVPAHVTELSNAVDEEMAPFSRAKNADPPRGALERPFGDGRSRLGYCLKHQFGLRL